MIACKENTVKLELPVQSYCFMKCYRYEHLGATWKQVHKFEVLRLYLR